MLFQKKKQLRPKVYSTELCQICNEHTRRLFQDGDYVYKHGNKCGKCGNLTIISAIYGEYPMKKNYK